MQMDNEIIGSVVAALENMTYNTICTARSRRIQHTRGAHLRLVLLAVLRAAGVAVAGGGAGGGGGGAPRQLRPQHCQLLVPRRHRLRQLLRLALRHMLTHEILLYAAPRQVGVLGNHANQTTKPVQHHPLHQNRLEEWTGRTCRTAFWFCRPATSYCLACICSDRPLSASSSSWKRSLRRSLRPGTASGDQHRKQNDDWCAVWGMTSATSAGRRLVLWDCRQVLSHHT
jgi:hypothetical protein